VMPVAPLGTKETCLFWGAVGRCPWLRKLPKQD